jgi:hypothetical protein
MVTDVPPPMLPPQQAEYIMLHDARSVHDSSSLRFKVFEINGVSSWVLAVVTPSSRSGSATVLGAYINGDTGELITPPNADTAVVKEGTLKVVAAAPQAKQLIRNQYSWTESLAQRKRALVPEDYYSPFSHGGTILCRPESSPNSLARFGPVHLLFSDWDKYVAPAFSVAERQPTLFEEAKRGDASQLEQLLTQDNKLLAVLAFRTLILAGLMTENVLKGQLSRADGQLLAIMTYLTLTNSGLQSGNQWVQELTSTVQSARNVQKIRPIALGAFATNLFRSGDGLALANSKSLLGTIRQRLGTLGVAIEKEPDLRLILEKMDVR